MINSIETFSASSDLGARRMGDHVVELGSVSDCFCRRCIAGIKVHGWPLIQMVMILCPVCGNKRCPKADDHRFECTGSNEPGQVGVTSATSSEINQNGN